MTSHGAPMMIGVIITQLQSSLKEQLIYYQLADMSSPAKDQMESTHWSGDLIEVKTKVAPSVGFPNLTKAPARPKDELTFITRVASSLACF